MDPAVKERPILFSGPMVRAFLGGKTQTRHLLKVPPLLHTLARPTRFDLHPEHGWAGYGEDLSRQTHWMACPIGVTGDRLWVRETWRLTGAPIEGEGAIIYRAEEMLHPRDAPRAAYEQLGLDAHGRKQITKAQWDEAWQRPGHFGCNWRPAGRMPRWASRLTLEVTGVRVERFQQISEEDARAEGLRPLRVDPALGWGDDLDVPARTKFSMLWDKLNGKRTPWASNPWVWVIDFKREK